jgi:RNA polymerase sigma factor (sigma-70 family)
LPAPPLPQWITRALLDDSDPDDAQWQRAWSVVYERYAPFVQGVLWHAGVRDEQSRDDLTHDALTRAAASFARYRDPDLGGFDRWVATIAQNLAKNWHAKRAAAASQAASSDEALEFSDHPDLSEAVLARVTLAAVRVKMPDVLNAKELRYMALFLDEDLTPVEIARLWGIREDHSRNMLARIRRKLRAGLPWP